MTSPPRDIYNIVEPYAQQEQVPDYVWETVVSQESGFNPELEGDNGQSIGLFQLNIVGGQGKGYTSTDLQDPILNAKIGMVYVGQAWSDLGSSFDDSYIWWNRFAIESGHPGGSTFDPATISLATKMKSYYDSNFSGSTTSNQVVSPIENNNNSKDNNILYKLGSYTIGVSLIIIGLLVTFKFDKSVTNVIKEAAK